MVLKPYMYIYIYLFIYCSTGHCTVVLILCLLAPLLALLKGLSVIHLFQFCTSSYVAMFLEREVRRCFATCIFVGVFLILRVNESKTDSRILIFEFLTNFLKLHFRKLHWMLRLQVLSKCRQVGTKLYGVTPHKAAFINSLLPSVFNHSFFDFSTLVTDSPVPL